MSLLILMSTFNGDQYLAEQLESIIAQTHQAWTLLIRDDGSTDNTLNIIKSYQATDPRIHLVEDARGNLKPCQSFATLMQLALLRKEDYIFFSDQDDVWQPTKLEKSLAVIHALEQQHGTHTPTLVHTDLNVVDQDLKLIHPSYLRFEGLQRNSQHPLRTLLINNYVTGCTMGLNRALLKTAAPIPSTAFMHDWWCALCAAATGQIGFVNEATMLYRQHHGNSIGSSGLFAKIKSLATLKKGFSYRLNNLKACFAQAHSLMLQTEQHDMMHHNTLLQFANLPKHTVFARYVNLHKLQVRPASRLRKIALLVMLAFT